LDILLASKAAGNTGVRNEIVSICDELLRQKVYNHSAFTRFSHDVFCKISHLTTAFIHCSLQI